MLSPSEWQEKPRSKSRHSAVSTNIERDEKQAEKKKAKKERKTAEGSKRMLATCWQLYKLFKMTCLFKSKILNE